MEFNVHEVEYNGLHFIIEEDFPEVGAYLYIYKDRECIKDFLQNDVNTSKKIAFEEYKVPFERWKF
ncbi:hypothetical protein [Sunxiuqinia elliptica]|uniref:Uncharacterized protein n=1 Tax=Sunxiuqinia elliptica TaxID=655355 RepID=A0A1I2LVX1_9BACT|nr:hypothetical protein [Sunxiuqinia elliptica]SFF83532.1 hypothetical protein SAMN05216283_11762 [Sunxiuqinia elliptica]